MEKQIISMLILLFIGLFHGQAKEKLSQNQHTFSFQTDYYQIKDGFNYGLVMNGINLNVGYDFTKITSENMFTYNADLAFGPGYRQGIALNWHFKPMDLFRGVSIENSVFEDLYLGGYTALNYQWQLYPELQSGHLLWFSSLEFGPKVHAKLNIGNREVKFAVSNSLAGFSSRPEPSKEVYFYSLKFSDFAGNPHSNIQFGSFNLMNHTNVKLELPGNKGKRLSLAYVFDYFGYYKNPKVEYLTHSINLSWKLGKKGNKS